MPETSERPFETAAQLREAHARLQAAIDDELGETGGEEAEAAAIRRHREEIRSFVLRGSATGILLDEVKDRTSCQVLLDYWARTLGGEVPPAASRLAPFDAEQLPSLEGKASPYVGLEAFRKATYFFGRERHTRALLEQLRASPLVAVLGASGSGKSSLVMGGLLPALAGEPEGQRLRILPVVVPGTAALEALAAALPLAARGGSAAEAAAELRRSPERLGALLGADAAPPTLVVLDQFEEVFTLSPPADREALAAALAGLLSGGRGHKVILTMREEFRSSLVALRPLAPHLEPEAAWYAMRPLAYEELLDAVERPAALVGLQFQSGVADDMAKKVLGQAAALPLLQFTLQELWRRKHRNRITWEIYRAVGDPLQALPDWAERFYGGLAPQTQEEVRRVLLALVRVDELLEAYRKPLPREELLRAGRANTPEVLELLSSRDVLRVSDGVVELKHEALIRNWPRFGEWIAEKRRQQGQRLALSQAAARWEERGRPDEGLLTGWQLEDAERLEDLAPREREFVERSRGILEEAAREREREQEREKERLRRRAEEAERLALRERRLKRRAQIGIAVIAVALVLELLAVYGLSRANRSLSGRREQLEVDNADLKARAAKLETEKAKVEAEKRDIQEKYEREVGRFSTEAAQALPVASAIFLHISTESQRARAEEVAASLRKNGVDARLPPGQRLDPVTQSSVRYFHTADRAGAEALGRQLGAFLVGEPLEVKPVPGLEGEVPRGQFEIWFGLGALGARRPELAFPSPTYLVLSNDQECEAAVDAFLAAGRGLRAALGPEFQPDDLRLVRGTARGVDYFVTAYGRELGPDAVAAFLQRLRGQPEIRRDAYASRIQFYREQSECRVADRALARLHLLAAEYVQLRAAQASGRERTRAMTALFDRMRAVAAGAGLEPSVAANLHRRAEDAEGSRVAALAAVRAAPSPAHLPLVLESIGSPLPGAAFEQYQALHALAELPSLTTGQWDEARAAVESAWTRNVLGIRNDPSRSGIASRLRRPASAPEPRLRRGTAQ